MVYSGFLIFATKIIQNVADDVYKSFKEKIKNIALKKDSDKNFKDSGNCGYLSISYDDKEHDMDFYIAIIYKNEEHLEMFLNSLYTLDKIIHKAQLNNIFPFNRPETFDMHIEYNFSPEPLIKLRVRRFIEEDNELEVNEFFDTVIPLGSLNDLRWSLLEWEILVDYDPLNIL